MVLVSTMQYKVDRGPHSVYSLYYHLIFVVKYGKRVMTEEIDDFLKQKVREISDTFRAGILAIETNKDHIHMLFKATPKLDIPRYINALKTITSREKRKKFPEVRKKLWKNVFWSLSYFLATSGQVTLDVLKKYVESQGKKNVEKS